VAWAACHYLDWTGDEEFGRGSGLSLLVETARYWASRVRVDGLGRAHIYGVIGPDEYHEPVDDNAFTNVMARWNLHRAAVAAEDTGEVAPDERRRWLELADALVDGFDPRTGLYEQFDGFFDLEPIVIRDVAPRRPVAADLLLGRERVQGAQVVKQADVLMLHHLVPEEVNQGSLLPNLRYYEPRTAHGSSLSPGVHAAVFARAGLQDAALKLLHLAARMDLDDLTGTTAGGLHLATIGSVWQALALGFAGLRPRADALSMDPRLPPTWNGLEIRVRFRGTRVQLRMGFASVHVKADRPVPVRVGEAAPVTVGPAGVQFLLTGGAWEVIT
jgi:trehalose/maltose hydrolase-like predicted phosphorylase